MLFCGTGRWERIITVIAVVFVLIASMFMASSLVGLKSCVSEFDPDAHHDAGTNQERRWKQWLENLELVMDFKGITDPAEGPSKKRAALLAVGGAALRELFVTLTVADTQYSTAKAALTAHFTAKKNLTAERYKFFCTKPESPEESHNHWVTRLRVKGADYEFDKMDLESAITLVLTLHTYSEKLQREIIAQDMDLTRALSTARSIELTEKEIAFMKQNPLQSLATPVHAERGLKQTTPPHSKPKSKTFELCRYCGERMPHKGKCKAMGATCNNCQKRNHFASVCEAKKQIKPIKMVTSEDIPVAGNSQDQYMYNNSIEAKLDGSLDVAYTHSASARSPLSHQSYPDAMVKVRLEGGSQLQMQLDTGADANIIDEGLYHQLQPKPKLKAPQIKLKPYNSPAIPVMGYFQTTLTANRQQALATIYVVTGSEQRPLLGKYTAFDLHLLNINIEALTAKLEEPLCNTEKAGPHTAKNGTLHLPYAEMAQHLTPSQQSVETLHNIYEQYHAVPDRTEAIIAQHPNVSKGIGKHKYRVVELSVDKSVTPRIQPQRRIPFARRHQFEEILKELEEADTIETVHGPTEWVSNVVLTPKADKSQLRMSIDMTKVNKAIKRTRHTIPTLEELRYKLNGAMHFTKLDMKQGYLQFELKPESRYLTTFYTHQGLRRFKRLNFGTNSAAEIFNEEIRQTLVDIENVANIYDDILVFGKSQQEHDQALLQVLQRFDDCGLTLGRAKCIFNQNEVKFFGMSFSSKGMSPYQDKVQALHAATPPSNAAEVRSFLGMANFSAHFIPQYSTITTPLRMLTRKNFPFHWTEECQQAFQSIKQALSLDTILAYYDPE